MGRVVGIKNGDRVGPGDGNKDGPAVTGPAVGSDVAGAALGAGVGELVG